MIDIMAARLGGGTAWRHWRDMDPTPSAT
jgi:hypothetical protein